MIKVIFYSELLEKYVTKPFDDAEEAQEFAIRKRGIIVA